MKKYFILIYSLISVYSLKAQPVDSLVTNLFSETNTYKQAFDISTSYNELSAATSEAAKDFLNNIDSLFSIQPSSLRTATLGLLKSNEHYKKNEQVLALQQAINSIGILDSLQGQSTYISMLQVRALLAAAAAHSQTGNYDTAIDYQIQALSLADEIGFLKGKAETNNLLAITYFSSKVGSKQSLQYFEEAIKNASELRDSFMLATIYGNMSTVFLLDKELDLAANYLRRALRINTALGLDLKQAFNHYYLGGVLVKKDEIAQAEEHARLATKIFKDNQYIRGLPLVYSLWGSIYRHKEELTKAVKNYSLALEHTPSTGQHKYRVDLYKQLAELENKQGNYAKANEYFQANLAEQDSINQRLNLTSIVNAESSYKLREIEKEKRFLKKEKQLQATIINSQRKSLFLLLALLILSIATGFIMWLQHKKLNLSYKILVDKNRALIQEKQKQDRLKTLVKKQASNTATDSTIDAIIPKIRQALEEEKAFLDQNLTAKKLADHLQTNTSYLTKAIKQHYNKNYSSLLKEYRIAEVLKAIELKKHELYTIETLANQAGFKSKSVFFNAFKEQTGVTPSFYIKQIEEEK